MAEQLAEIIELLGPAAIMPIEQYVEEVATSTALPAYAIGICLIRIDEAGPMLRTALARAILDEPLTKSDELLVFRGLHILGGARDTRSFKPLMLLLRRPPEVVEYLLGDAITESLSKIVVGVFDGDADALLAAIADRHVDEFVRDALLGATAFLAWNGQIDRDNLRQFLVRFYEERLADDEDHAWVGWQETIALLGLRALQPIVHQAFRDGLIPANTLGPEDFDADLDAAENAPDDIARFQVAGTGYIEDVLVALEWTDPGQELFGDETVDNADEDLWDEEWFLPATPIVNPLRAVGRNDPCPCGSGKKFKKCCLAP